MFYEGASKQRRLNSDSGISPGSSTATNIEGPYGLQWGFGGVCSIVVVAQNP